jgi:hypothetical protein
MKKIILLFVLVFVAASVDAQLYVGGAVSASIESKNDVEATTFKILPEAGYNISDKFAVGAVIGFSRSSYDGKSLGSTFQFAPYARFSFYRSDLVRLFVDGGFSVYSNDIGDETITTFDIGVKPGIALDLSEKISIVGKFGFIGFRHYDDDHNKIDMSIDATDISIGLFYSF